MLINQTFEIDSCDDVELNIKELANLNTALAMMMKKISKP